MMTHTINNIHTLTVKGSTGRNGHESWRFMSAVSKQICTPTFHNVCGKQVISIKDKLKRSTLKPYLCMWEPGLNDNDSTNQVIGVVVIQQSYLSLILRMKTTVLCRMTATT